MSSHQHENFQIYSMLSSSREEHNNCYPKVITDTIIFGLNNMKILVYSTYWKAVTVVGLVYQKMHANFYSIAMLTYTDVALGSMVVGVQCAIQVQWRFQ
ncbi:hypothetical protein T4B_6625 [Trichinella pseudospiralis]|uniref:Uncharacterized protein n=1 Tax=Trichinella pseudospiralis TaxID=6337 RepID=A0A0V1IMC6_TRIPS|nr:hypothetical protein T4B_6625 [Trichinella pseudospiralis]